MTCFCVLAGKYLHLNTVQRLVSTFHIWDRYDATPRVYLISIVRLGTATTARKVGYIGVPFPIHFTKAAKAEAVSISCYILSKEALLGIIYPRYSQVAYVAMHEVVKPASIMSDEHYIVEGNID